MVRNLEEVPELEISRFRSEKGYNADVIQYCKGIKKSTVYNLGRF